MTKKERITFLILFSVGIFLTLAFAEWWFLGDHVAHNFGGLAHAFDYVFFIALSYIVWLPIAMELFGWYT